MLQITKKGWGIFFISPSMMELIKDFVFSHKGSAEGINSPDMVAQKALEGFLSNRGYRAHIEEIKEQKLTGKKPEFMTPITVGPKEKEAMEFVMQHLDLTETEAAQWVRNHPKEVTEAFG